MPAKRKSFSRSKPKPKAKPRMNDKLRERGRQFEEDYPQLRGTGEFARDVSRVGMKTSNRESRRRSYKS